MNDTLLQSMAEFGVLATLLTMFVITFIWFFTKYIPRLVEKHFEVLDKMHDKFSSNLEQVTNNNSSVNKGFLESIDKLGHEHEEQMKILREINGKIK